MSKAATIHDKVKEVFSPERERALAKAHDKAPTREQTIAQIKGEKKK